jgi:hypothetical protein
MPPPQEQPQEQPQEIAFYYPGHLWQNADWMKTLLLFFDGIGLLVPEYKKGEPEVADPHLAAPLREQGLLHYLVADQVVDAEVTKDLAVAVTEFVNSGALDSLAKDQTGFHELSMSRMGFYGNREIAGALFDQLAARGLALKSQDGVSIPLHPSVRYLILVLLAQIIRTRGAPPNTELSPATDQTRIVRALTEVLGVPILPSAGNVVAFDLQSVSVDLSSIPLDEVLSFRAENLAAHRRYARSARQFARELSLLPEAARTAAFVDRQSELDDLASDLRRKARSAWRQPASFALGLAGAGWTLVTGNPLGALLSASALFAKGPGAARAEAGAFSYLFAAHERYA